MVKLIYNPYFFYNSSSFTIVRMEIDDILILANKDFANTK